MLGWQVLVSGGHRAGVGIVKRWETVCPPHPRLGREGAAGALVMGEGPVSKDGMGSVPELATNG